MDCEAKPRRGGRRKTADVPPPAGTLAGPVPAIAGHRPAGTPAGAKLHEGVWLPAIEEHLVQMMTPGAKRFARLPDGRASYQRHKFLTALALVADSGVFVDVGAHVGLWSMQAEADGFRRIVAFEPCPLHADLYPFNLRGTDWTLHRCALGEGEGTVSLTAERTSTGDTHVAGPGDIPMRTLDSFGLDRVDLLKVDTEGYELPILRGAVETLTRCRPVVVVEQKGREVRYHGGQAGEAVAFLREMGMVELAPSISGDFFMGWRA